MPRFSRLRSSVLEDFAEQQRFAPARALRRQVERAEALIGEIEATGAYPEDWVIFKLTGYRPDIEEPASLVGEALLADLPALVERLSDGARFSAAELSEESLSPAEVCRRWRISRRTLERYRRFGLAARRARSARGKPIIRFMRGQIEAFERREAARLSRGEPSGVRRRVRRVGTDERAALHESATRLAKEDGASLSRASAALARERGRSLSTVRRAVLKQDRQSAKEARAFPERAGVGDAERRAIFVAHRRGEEPGALAARFGRSRASIHRIVNEARAAALRALDLTGPRPELATENAVARRDDAGGASGPAFDPRFFALGARQGLGAPVPLSPGAFAADARAAAAPAAREEQGRAAAYHAILAECERRTRALARFNPPAAELDEIETLLRWAAMVKVELARSQSGLVLRTIEERTGGVFEELPPERRRELHARAFEAVARAIDGFDPFPRAGKRPGRLAAPVTVELARALAPLDERVGEEQPTRARATAMKRDAESSAELRDWTRSITPWGAAIDPPAGARERSESLPEPARGIVQRHFGWLGEPPMTIEELTNTFKISRIRICRLIRAVNHDR